ncbi:hypothetical protein T484DRAFT_1748892 [Baffinella frigidus]|jgi:hypothetical protein|nr:hypothetical protein T484DRAFT_1748892 [Cryptophyta sp. CCMP2293]
MGCGGSKPGVAVVAAPVAITPSDPPGQTPLPEQSGSPEPYYCLAAERGGINSAEVDGDGGGGDEEVSPERSLDTAWHIPSMRPVNDRRRKSTPRALHLDPAGPVERARVAMRRGSSVGSSQPKLRRIRQNRKTSLVLLPTFPPRRLSRSRRLLRLSIKTHLSTCTVPDS